MGALALVTFIAPRGPSNLLDGGEACPDGAACQCENHWFFSGSGTTPPPACHASVTAALYSYQHGCCDYPAGGCNQPRNCSGLVKITAIAKIGQSCVYQISGPNGATDCAPGGCATLSHTERYNLECLDFSEYTVEANGILLKTVQVDCDGCAG